MSIAPIITFKAGKCDADYSVTPAIIKPIATPGFLYLYSEDELLHFCWRERSARLSEPELDLVMVPTDGNFKPYLGPEKVPNKSPVNGRIFVLKFNSSPQRHMFWLQSREHPQGQPNHFSARDLKLGEIVDSLLQGEDLDTNAAIASIRSQGPGGNDEDGDATMEDAQPDNQDATGGAGAGATGGDVREEGEDSREGGADGARANRSVEDQTSDAVRSFLNSLGAGNMELPQQRNKPFTTLAELLASNTTVPMVENASPEWLEDLLVKHLPPALLFLELQVDDAAEAQADTDTLRASAGALSDDQKRDIVKKVLRSPQFFQGLISLTVALSDGGLPTVSEALGVEVKNGGYTGPDRRVPLSGGEAVEAFIEGIKSLVARSRNERGSS